MPRIVIDFETRSTINLKKCGAYVYAAHPDTEILMMGYKIDDGPAQIWWPVVKPLEYTFPFPVWSAGWEVVAHNAEFEMCMWREIMHKRLGYPDIPLQNWDDTAARASMCALPRSLDGVCQALGLQHQKDDEGHRLMLQMCKPKPLTKKMRLELAVELGTQDFIEQEGKFILSRLAADPEAPSYLRPDYRRFYRWKEDPASMQRLAEYCLKDVEAEYELDRVLPALPPKERRIWELDRKINACGIKVDIPAVKNIIYTLKKHEEKLNGLLHQLSGGAVSTAKSSAALAQFLELPNVQKTTISDALQNEEDPIKKRVLSIRQSLGQSSVAKFQSLISATDPRDSRIRGLLLYHGAGPGRWAGKLFQPQNLPRGDQDRFPSPDDIIEMFALRDPEIIEVLYGDPVEAAVNCIRGMLISDDDLLVNDYSSVEGRGMPWAAGEQHVLQAYIDGKDMYKVAAQAIFHCKYEDVTPKQRKIGKVPELACIAEGTLVITDSGPVPIELVSLDMRVWDGENFVAHEGVARHGQKLCVNFVGIEATLDHKIFIGTNLWKTLEDLQEDSLLRLSAINTGSLSLSRLKKVHLEVFERCHAAAHAATYPECSNQISRQERVLGASNVEEKRETKREQNSTLSFGITQHVDAFLTELRQRLSDADARPIGSILPTADEASRYSGGKIKLDSSAISQPSTVGMIAPSPWTGLTMTKDMNLETCDSSVCPNSSTINSRPSGSNTTGSASREQIFGKDTAQNTEIEELCSEKFEKGSLQRRLFPISDSVKERTVYDIINAGPNSRFTVLTETGALVVHNCQYAGADGAMLKFGADRLGLEKEEREKIVQQWREDRPATVSIWHMLSDAAEHATRYGTNSDLCAARERLRGQLWRQKYHWWNWLMQAEEWPQWKRIVFGINGPFLCMKLPSGRLIRYYAPKIEMVQTPWGKHREAVTAMRMVKVGTREVWMRDSLSGGTLANNLIQGLCRDIIADAMLRLDENGFPIVLTVHDEIVAEDQGARFSLFKQLMDEVPSWAEGFPIASNGFYAKRYKKD